MPGFKCRIGSARIPNSKALGGGSSWGHLFIGLFFPKSNPNVGFGDVFGDMFVERLLTYVAFFQSLVD